MSLCRRVWGFSGSYRLQGDFGRGSKDCKGIPKGHAEPNTMMMAMMLAMIAMTKIMNTMIMATNVFTPGAT